MSLSVGVCVCVCVYFTVRFIQFLAKFYHFLGFCHPPPSLIINPQIWIMKIFHPPPLAISPPTITIQRVRANVFYPSTTIIGDIMVEVEVLDYGLD